MVDPRWKRPLVVLFQQHQATKEQPGFDIHEAASFVEEIKDAVRCLDLAIQAMELRLQAVEDGSRL